MAGVAAWIEARWQDTLVPLAVFAATLILLLWLRRVLVRRLLEWAQKTPWPGDELLVRSLPLPSLLWALLLSAYLGMQASQLPPGWKVPIGRGLWTLLVASVAYLVVRLSVGFSALYANRWRGARRALHLASNLLISLVATVTLLIVASVWGVATGPILMAAGIVAVVAAVALRDVVPNLVAFLQIAAAAHIRTGDYIKLETGEEGEVLELGWAHTRLRGLDGAQLTVPNAKLARTTVVNYGRLLKKARSPFHFYTRAHLTELTGDKARTLGELMATLKDAPDSVVYYHTHRFLEEHQYLTPTPANDFAVWVSTALGDEVLGEKLAVVDAFEFPTLGALRERLVGIIQEHVASTGNDRVAPEDREFHFAKSIAFITPTPYLAHDLREFVGGLHKLSLSSLYFHMFDARLRLQRGTNDFAAWIADSLEDAELAAEVARLDPYNYTLEGLRSSLVQLVEKRIE